MKYLILVLLVFQCSPGFAQSQIITIHPAVGDTIDLQEKRKFNLFTSFSDKDFSYAYVLRKQDSSYVVRVKTLRSGLQEKQLEQDDPELMYQSIQLTLTLGYNKSLSPIERKAKKTAEMKLPGKKGIRTGRLILLGTPVVLYIGARLSWDDGTSNFKQSVGSGLIWIGILAIPVSLVMIITGRIKNYKYKKQQKRLKEAAL